DGVEGGGTVGDGADGCASAVRKATPAARTTPNAASAATQCFRKACTLRSVGGRLQRFVERLRRHEVALEEQLAEVAVARALLAQRLVELLAREPAAVDQAVADVATLAGRLAHGLVELLAREPALVEQDVAEATVAPPL